MSYDGHPLGIDIESPRHPTRGILRIKGLATKAETLLLPVYAFAAGYKKRRKKR